MNALPLLAAAALMAPGLPAPQSFSGQWATDLSGLWIVSSSLGGRAVMIDCNVLQLGAQLFGSCEPEARDATPVALQGRIDGAQASWGYDLPDQGGSARLQYQAAVLSNAAMNGTLTYAGTPAAFTAVRK